MTYSDEDLDQLLKGAGESWRRSQPRIGNWSVASLVQQRGQSRRLSFDGPVAAIGFVVLGTAGLIFLLLGGPLGSPAVTAPPVAPPTTGGPPNTLYVENRGGPTIVVAIDNEHATTVECNGAVSMTPGTDGLPPLPWDVTITRSADGAAVLAQRLVALPRWFVQIGNTPLGLSDMPVLGPMGPPCPPVSASPSCRLSEASQLAVAQAVNEDSSDFGGVYVDDNGIVVIEYVGTNNGLAAVEAKVDCAAGVRWVQVQRSQMDLRGIMAEIGNRIDAGEPALSHVFAVGLDTVGNQIEVRVGPPGTAADVAALLDPIYGDAVRVVFDSDLPVIH